MPSGEGLSDHSVKVLNAVVSPDGTGLSVDVLIDGERVGHTFPMEGRMMREDSMGRPRWLLSLVRLHDRRKEREASPELLNRSRAALGKVFSTPNSNSSDKLK